jgi:hypothetical protein
LKSVGNDIERGKFTLGPLLHRTRYKPNTCCVPLFLYSNYTDRQTDRRMFQKEAHNIVSHGSLRDKTSVTSSQNYHCRSYRIRLSFERIIFCKCIQMERSLFLDASPKLMKLLFRHDILTHIISGLKHCFSLVA